MAHEHHSKPKWPLFVGILVWAGIAATNAIAFIQSFWG